MASTNKYEREQEETLDLINAGVTGRLSRHATSGVRGNRQWLGGQRGQLVLGAPRVDLAALESSGVGEDFGDVARIFFGASVWEEDGAAEVAETNDRRAAVELFGTVSGAQPDVGLLRANIGGLAFGL
jgi:hypothetical protein